MAKADLGQSTKHTVRPCKGTGTAWEHGVGHLKHILLDKPPARKTNVVLPSDDVDTTQRNNLQLFKPARWHLHLT